jgi:rhodanese-related sulfurtransferase
VNALQHVTVHELVRRLREPAPPLLLDVREDNERAIGAIPHSVHIPMSQIQRRLSELDERRETVVYCHHGVRSQRVGEFLRASGFSRVASLDGGIDAWSVEVDPTVPRY